MPRFFCLAALAVIPATLAMSETAPVPHGSPVVIVLMDFDSRPGIMSVSVMKREVDGLLRRSGITLDWRSSTGSPASDTFNGLVSFRFKGQCRVEGWYQPERDGVPSGTEALGFTEVANGQVMPFSEVECDQIRKGLAYLDPGSSPQERQQAFGLAMGRVVAHELYHILARTTNHAEEGLAKAKHSLRDLVSASAAMAFAESDSLAIGQALTARH